MCVRTMEFKGPVFPIRLCRICYCFEMTSSSRLALCETFSSFCVTRCFCHTYTCIHILGGERRGKIIDSSHSVSNFGLHLLVDHTTHLRCFYGLFHCLREGASIVRKTKVAFTEA